MTLSIAMIVKNEASNLGRCLSSAQGLADQIVVVDTGSTDTTVQIAESFGATIGHFDWCDDFGEARNHSLSLVTSSWFLMLDADEALDSNDFEVITKATRGQRDLYKMHIRNYGYDSVATMLDVPFTKNTGLYPEYPYQATVNGARLFRMKPGIAYRGRLHENIDWCYAEKPKQIDATIHHFGKLDPGREKYKEQFYYKIAKQDLADSPDDLRSIQNAVVQARVARDWPFALECVKHYLELCITAPCTIAMTGAEAYQAMGDHAAAVPMFLAILRTFPDNVLAMNRLAISLSASGDVDGARALLLVAMGLNPGFTSSHAILADIESQLGNREWARGAIEAGLKANPNDQRLHRLLAKYNQEV